MALFLPDETESNVQTKQSLLARHALQQSPAEDAAASKAGDVRLLRVCARGRQDSHRHCGTRSHAAAAQLQQQIQQRIEHHSPLVAATMLKWPAPSYLTPLMLVHAAGTTAAAALGLSVAWPASEQAQDKGQE